jgi:hypothetical protein
MNSIRDELRRGSDSGAGRVGSRVGIRYRVGPAKLAAGPVLGRCGGKEKGSRPVD